MLYERNANRGRPDRGKFNLVKVTLESTSESKAPFKNMLYVGFAVWPEFDDVTFLSNSHLARAFAESIKSCLQTPHLHPYDYSQFGTSEFRAQDLRVLI